MGIQKRIGPVQRLRSSFSLKLTVLFLSVVLVIGGIGGVIYVQTGDALGQNTEQNMKQSTVLQANTVGEWVERTTDKTDHLSRSDVVASGDQRRIGEFLESEHETTPASVAVIHYYDTTTNDVLVSTEAGAVGTNYGEITASDVEFAADDGTRAHRTHPYDDPVTEKPAIAFISQVPDEPDRAIVLVVDLETQAGQLEPPSTNDRAFTHIVNSRGTVVMSHHTDRINEQNMGQDEFEPMSMGVKRGLKGEIDYEEMPMHGETMSMGFAPVEGTDWVIMTHIPKEAAYALQDDITRSVGALIVLSIVGLGLIGTVVGRNTTRSIGRLVEQANDLEEGNLDAELETDRIDEIGQLYDAFDNMRLSLRKHIEEVEDARARTVELNSHLEAKANEYRYVMQACSDGNLTRRMDPDSESEAMEAIAVEFNRMMSELEKTIEQLSNFADDVAASSEYVTASTEEAQSASTQVAASIQEISEGAERQNERLQSVTHEMEGLSTTTEEIAASSNEVADLAEATAQTGQEGQDAAQAAVTGLNEVKSESQRAVEAIEALEAEIEQIDELVEFISEVAEQTNMLALNANIEAARTTTSSDDGFGVVASEVKDLAKETKEAAETIEARIESIKAQTAHSAGEVQTTSDRLVHHQDTLERTVEALEEIAEYAERTNDGVQEISAATEQQAASTQEVVAMVEEAATISEETTAETENAAAAGEEQTSVLSEVTDSIDQLSQQAMQLSSELDQFDTDAGIASAVSRLDDVDDTGDSDIRTDGSTGESHEFDPSSASGAETPAAQETPDDRDDDADDPDGVEITFDEADDVVERDETRNGDGNGDEDDLENRTQRSDETNDREPVDDEMFSFVDDEEISSTTVDDEADDEPDDAEQSTSESASDE